MRLKIERLLVLILFILSSFAFGQKANEKLVSGVVRDEKGELPQSISVTVKRTTNVVTNEHGVVSIVVKASGVSAFTPVGLETIELKPTSNELNTTLTVESKSLSDVVVVGYGSQKNAKVTGVIATISMDSVLGNTGILFFNQNIYL